MKGLHIATGIFLLGAIGFVLLNQTGKRDRTRDRILWETTEGGHQLSLHIEKKGDGYYGNGYDWRLEPYLLFDGVRLNMGSTLRTAFSFSPYLDDPVFVDFMDIVKFRSLEESPDQQLAGKVHPRLLDDTQFRNFAKLFANHREDIIRALGTVSSPADRTLFVDPTDGLERVTAVLRYTHTNASAGRTFISPAADHWIAIRPDGSVVGGGFPPHKEGWVRKVGSGSIEVDGTKIMLRFRGHPPTSDLGSYVSGTEYVLIHPPAHPSSDGKARLGDLVEIVPYEEKQSGIGDAGRREEQLPDKGRLMKEAALLVWYGKNEEYETYRRKALLDAADTKNADFADATAKLSCLRPIEDDAVQAAALALAQRAVELSDGDLGDWFQMGRGIAEYRSTAFTKSEATLKPLRKTDSRIVQTATYYRAMSLLRQGKPAEARTLFTETEAVMLRLPVHTAAEAQNHDDLILWLAYREASALLGMPQSKAPLPAPAVK